MCHLGIHELAFRGHGESESSDNKGNYVDKIYLLCQYDELLSNHLDSATVFSELSNHISNDLINSVASVLLEVISNEIKSASFVAMSLDETTDCRNIAQLSTVLRYYLNGKIYERFIELNRFPAVCATINSKSDYFEEYWKRAIKIYTYKKTS